MKYKLVVADVDGTILPPSELPALRPSKRLIQTVKKVQERGVVFSIATGRSLTWVTEVIDAFNLTSPIILDNGARIYDSGRRKNIWVSFLEKETAQKVIAILMQNKGLKIIVSDDGNRLENVDDITKWKITKIIALGVTPQKAQEIVHQLKVLKDLSVTISISGVEAKSQSVHITNYNATKQIAVARIINLLGIKKEETIAIGDSYNDFPLLMAGGLKVAMGNAVSDLKEIADYIAPPYNEDGVVTMLEKFVLKGK